MFWSFVFEFAIAPTPLVEPWNLNFLQRSNALFITAKCLEDFTSGIGGGARRRSRHHGQGPRCAQKRRVTTIQSHPVTAPCRAVALVPLAIAVLKAHGLSQQSVAGAIAALNIQLSSVGALVGPVIGSAAFGALGLPWYLTILGFVGVAVVALGIFILLPYHEPGGAAYGAPGTARRARRVRVAPFSIPRAALGPMLSRNLSPHVHLARRIRASPRTNRPQAPPFPRCLR